MLSFVFVADLDYGNDDTQTILQFKLSIAFYVNKITWIVKILIYFPIQFISFRIIYESLDRTWNLWSVSIVLVKFKLKLL